MGLVGPEPADFGSAEPDPADSEAPNLEIADWEIADLRSEPPDFALPDFDSAIASRPLVRRLRLSDGGML